MDAFDQLQATFETYLTTLPDMQMRPAMIDALREAGLHEEANALALYAPGQEPVTTWQSGVWSGKRCFVSAHMPTAGQPGDLWFDVVELATHVFVPHLPDYSKDVTAWLAIHPVWMWQFKAFLNVVKWRVTNTPFIAVTDLMSVDRFQETPGHLYADNLYHEEAVAYASWFQKGMCDLSHMKSAREFLRPAQLGEVSPEGFKLWQIPQEFDEFVRTAYEVNTLDKSAEEQFAEYEALDAWIGSISPDRTVFAEWECQLNLGLSTAVTTRNGLFPSELTTRPVYEFAVLLNKAQRPG